MEIQIIYYILDFSRKIISIEKVILRLFLITKKIINIFFYPFLYLNFHLFSFCDTLCMQIAQFPMQVAQFPIRNSK